MKITILPFAQAVELNKNVDAEFSPFATLNESGKAKVRAFADAFYDGLPYNADAVFSEFEQEAEQMLSGYSHIVELRRVNKSGNGFHIDTLHMEPEDYDWSINE